MNDQRSLTEQMWDLVQLANQNGLYDAADWVTRTFSGPMAGVPGLRQEGLKTKRQFQYAERARHSNPEHDTESCPRCR